MLDLYDATYGRNEGLWTHPYGKFNNQELWGHVDRIGFRLPDAFNTTEEKKRNNNGRANVKGKKKRNGQLQRSLTPHLDCCPDDMYGGGSKTFPRWRPIQCFLSLSTTLNSNQGGFECVKGFHRKFNQYYNNRKMKNEKIQNENKLPCVGDYVHIDPSLDSAVMSKVAHVPVEAGDAVFWDQRIPHSNSYKNDSVVCRKVVYGGFLPKGVEMNDVYVKEQLKRLKGLEKPSDFWIGKDGEGGGSGGGGGEKLFDELSVFGKGLLR